jgi:hypothetical protein
MIPDAALGARSRIIDKNSIEYIDSSIFMIDSESR